MKHVDSRFSNEKAITLIALIITILILLILAVTAISSIREERFIILCRKCYRKI